MPGLGSLVSGLKPIAGRRRAECYLIALDDKGAPDTSVKGRPNTRKFQYFPETITDSKAINYATKEIPGGSLPLYQWVNSGARTISFSAVFTTDVDHIGADPTRFERADPNVPSLALPADDGKSIGRMLDRLRASGAELDNPYIPGALYWLRSFMLPTYTSSTAPNLQDTPLTSPPKKLLLVLEGSRIEWLGGRGIGTEASGKETTGIPCIMTQCEISYEMFFPSGNPRIATVQLAFEEVPQLKGVIQFPRAFTEDGSDIPEREIYKFAPSYRKK